MFISVRNQLWQKRFIVRGPTSLASLNNVHVVLSVYIMMFWLIQTGKRQNLPFVMLPSLKMGHKCVTLI